MSLAVSARPQSRWSFTEAVYAGVGVIQLPMMMFWEDFAASRLMEVASGWQSPAGGHQAPQQFGQRASTDG